MRNKDGGERTRGTIAAAIVAAVTGCIPGFGGTPAPEGYVRVEGDIVIPSETGPYDLQRVEPSPIVVIGTQAHYAIPKEEPQTLAPFDLFIYPMGGRELEGEIAGARELIREYDRLVPEIEGTTLGPTVTLEPVYAPYPLHMTPIVQTINGQPVRSFMYITRIENRFLKVRVTYAATSAEQVDRAMHRWVELLIDDIARQNPQ